MTELTLITCVGMQLRNQALGNISIGTMQARLLVQTWIWKGMLGTAALHSALSTRFCIRLGIGGHGSPAVLGETGYVESRIFTPLADAANVASGLAAVCKDFGCQAVVPAAEALAPSDAGRFPPHEIAVRAPSARPVVHTINDVTRLLH